MTEQPHYGHRKVGIEQGWRNQELTKHGPSIRRCPEMKGSGPARHGPESYHNHTASNQPSCSADGAQPSNPMPAGVRRGFLNVE